MMTQMQTPYIPETLGYDSSRLGVLNEFLQKLVDKKAVSGACYGLSRDGKMFAGGAVGKRSYRADEERPMKPDAIFCIASITKLFTAVSIFQLVENGLCRLDNKMADWFPEMEADFPTVTIAHALSHTGGLPVDGGVYTESGKPDPWELINKELDSGGRDWIAAALSLGPTSESGTRWEYSSFGWVLLGVLIERLTGIRAERYIEQNILLPCGMNDSGYPETLVKPPDYMERVFIRNEGMEQWFERAKDEELHPVPSTGGGMFSTVSDMIRFGNMLLGGGRIDGRRVLGRVALEKMTAEYACLPNFCWEHTGALKPYGLGPDLTLGDVYLGPKGIYYHEGYGRVMFMLNPAERFVSVFFAPQPDPDVWDPVVAYNAHNIIVSGLM